MPIEVRMPKLEMSQETAQIVEWIKQEGELVKKGEPLLTVETDKVTIDIDAPDSGILTGIRAQKGQTVPVVSVIAYLLQPGEESIASGSAQPPAEAPAQSKPGNGASATPLATRIAQTEGLDLAAIPGSGPGGKVTRADVQSTLNGKVRATPAARRIAREEDILLNEVPGSGPRGRIQAADVSGFILAAATLSDVKPLLQSTTETAGETLPGQVVPLQGMRRTIAQRLQSSYQTAPHITFTSRIDLTGVEELRAKMNAHARMAGAGRVSMTALIVKAVAWALESNPWLNSSLRGEEIHLLTDINVGVAVALKEGLIVPVVHAANQKSVRKISGEVDSLAAQARAGQLTPSEVAGGTFTISNLGPFGIEQFTAILNPGQTGILAVGASGMEPVAVGTQVEIHPVLRLTLSVDHRVVDGAVAAHFMADLKAALETPALILW